MKYIDDMSLPKKMAIPVIVMAILFAAATAFIAHGVYETSASYSQLVDHSSPAVLRLVRLNVRLRSLGYLLYRSATMSCLGADAADCKELDGQIRESIVLGEQAVQDAQTIDPDHSRDYESFLNRFKPIAATVLQAQALSLADRNVEAVKEMKQADRKISELSEALIAYNDARTKSNGDKAQELRADAARTLWASMILGLASILVGAAISLWISAAKISAPLLRLCDRTRSIAEGDVSVVVEGQNRDDEIGEMARCLDVFKAAAIAKVARDAKEAEDVKVWTAENEERASREAEDHRQDQFAIDAVAEGLLRLAGGDLTKRIETPFAPKTEKLRTDFNGALEKLKQAMLKVHVNSGGIHSGSGEISAAADDLSRRTEQQAASLEETAATLDEITSTVKNTAAGALQAQKLVSNAKNDADQSGEVVRQATAAMGGIEKSSRQIGQIIGVIDEIAFQTNLLALNAGVEAARAGDAGRGFAVVASEVRALAQRSAEAAKEIKGLISASTAQVAQGVDLVGEAGKALARIVVQVAEINTVVGSIASSAEEQASALHQVNAAVNQMDLVTQQNAAMVEETTAAAHSLRRESEELARLIACFEVGREAKAENARIEPGRAKAARLSPGASRTPPNALRTALKTTSAQSRGGAARKLESATVEESWEEF